MNKTFAESQLLRLDVVIFFQFLSGYPKRYNNMLLS